MNKDFSILHLTHELEGLREENKCYKDALNEIWSILNETPYREYTTNKIRYRLQEIATEGLKGESS